MTFTSLMFLKEKLVAHLFWDTLLVFSYLVGQSETTLLLLFIMASRSAPQSGVFLLPV
jgi:hypothetical protein